MDASNKNSPCKDCSDGDDGARLQAELEHLRRHLNERDSHILALEAELIKTNTNTNNLEEQLSTWREKYERLYDSHKRVQKLNQVLEDKLLQMVDKMKNEKSQLTKDIATLSVRLAESKHNYSMLQKENERYKNDMNLAIQLLQCKPDNFVSQKLDNLPVDTQARVSQYVMSKTKASGSSNSKNGNEIENFDTSEYEFNISASLMSKILEDSIQDTVTKHCDTCTCSSSQTKPFCYNDSHYSVATQTLVTGEMKNSLCLNCNVEVKSVHSNLSIRSSSPHGVKLINEKSPGISLTGPMYIIPQPLESYKQANENYKQTNENYKQGNENYKPIENYKPTIENYKPLIENYKLITENFKPPNENNKASSEDYKSDIYKTANDNYKTPTDNYNQLKDNYKLATENYKPSHENYKLGNENYKSLSGNHDAVNDNYKPSDENYKATVENYKAPNKNPPDVVKSTDVMIDIADKVNEEVYPKEVITKIGEELKQIRKSNGMSMEPAIHHKLCDRTKTPVSSKKSITSLISEDISVRDIPNKDNKSLDNHFVENMTVRKNSLSSMGAVSRTSSVAKSTTSTHKSNTHVGPGPRFCSLRMQAGSKNILLDNAQPDVPPVLYRRQSKCNENSFFKDLADGIDNFLNLDKNDNDNANDFGSDNIVVESTLIDVHVDNTNKETSEVVKNSSINPVLLNVSSSPLQPLKTHHFSNGSEPNNNQGDTIMGHKTTLEIDNLLTDLSLGKNKIDNPTKDNEGNIFTNPSDVTVAPSTNDVKIFNFDRYEQNKLSSQYARPLRKIDMSQFHTLENTKISKDHPPQGELPKIPKKDAPKNISTIVNVYPNLTQTHLKVNENRKVFTNEQSTSSLSSDDSAAILQKQQLLRVAEWVEKNLEQQNVFDDPLTMEEELSYNAKSVRRESKINRIADTLNELAMNMPHPVSKYSKTHSKGEQKNLQQNNIEVKMGQVLKGGSNMASVVKETIFPVEIGPDEACQPKTKENPRKTSTNSAADELAKNLSEVVNYNGEKDITPEELARMEYNVKQFLLSGPQWTNPETFGRSRRTSSKTETDV